MPDLTYNSDSDDEYDDEQSVMALACGAAQTNSDAEIFAAQVLDDEEEHERRRQSRLDIPDWLTWLDSYRNGAWQRNKAGILTASRS